MKADLKYVGPGYLVGVPARDLSAEEIEARGLSAKDLIGSGLYVEVKPVKNLQK